MSIKDIYKVEHIRKQETREWLLYKHYAKKIPQIQHAFGLYVSGVLNGIVTFGKSGNMNNNKMGDFNMLELNRLCINDNQKKNTASFFLSRSLLLLPIPTVVFSYADAEFGHTGYIYQATNFIYTGKDGGAEIYKQGNEHLHSKSFSDKYGRRDKAFAKKCGYKIYKTKGKHRYFYFLGSKSDKRRTLKQTDIKPNEYPK